MLDGQELLRLEQEILGTVLTAPEHVGEAVAALEEADFTDAFDRDVFAAVRALHLGGAPVTTLTVTERMGTEWTDAVRALAQFFTAPGNLAYYCELLRQRSRLRAVQAAAMRLIDTQSLDEAREALDALNGLMTTRKTVRLQTAAEAALAFYDRLNAPAPEYLKLGLDEIDRQLYTELGDFLVVGGYPSSGKTLLCLQFAAHLAAAYRVGFFSLETGTAKLLDRTMANLARVPLARIKTRDLGEADWAAITGAAQRMAALSLDYIDAGGMTVRDIQAVALSRRHQVVLVDYLQLIRTGGKSRYEAVTEVSQALHTMARQNGILVIALAQLSRPEKDKGKPLPPTMSSLRESGQIEQDADAILLLWPEDPNDYRSPRIAKLAKNKEGERGKWRLAFDGACQRLTVAEPTPGEKFRQLQRDIRRAGRGELEQLAWPGEEDDPDMPF